MGLTGPCPVQACLGWGPDVPLAEEGSETDDALVQNFRCLAHSSEETA